MLSPIQSRRWLLIAPNELHNAIDKKKETDFIISIFHRLQKYTKEHFEREEHLMSEYGFPELSAHRREHLTFIHLVHALRHVLQNSPGSLSFKKLLRFLERWLMQHILVEDKKYTTYLTGRQFDFQKTDIIKPMHINEGNGAKCKERDTRNSSEWISTTVCVPDTAKETIQRCAKILQIGGEKAAMLEEISGPEILMNNEEAHKMIDFLIK